MADDHSGSIELPGDPLPAEPPPVKKGGAVFARVPVAAIVDPELNDGDLRVLGAICAYMRSDNWAWPSQTLLALATARSRSAANRSVKKLSRQGHVDVHHNRHRDGSLRCSYLVNFTPKHLPKLPRWGK